MRPRRIKIHTPDGIVGTMQALPGFSKEGSAWDIRGVLFTVHSGKVYTNATVEGLADVPGFRPYA